MRLTFKLQINIVNCKPYIFLENVYFFKYDSDKNGSTNVFFKLPGDNALKEKKDKGDKGEKDEPVTPIYLGFDVSFKEHTSYFHPKYYNLSTGQVFTPQFYNISFRVSSLEIFKLLPKLKLR